MTQIDPRIVALGQHISELREARGLTQQELADRSSVVRTTIWELEHGRRNPSYTTILDIADALGVSEHILLPPRP